MSRVMIIGYGPLPAKGLKLFAAPSLRTRHLLHAALEGGHSVYLYTLPLPGTEGPEGEVAAMVAAEYEGLHYQRFQNHSGEFAIRALNEQVLQHKPDAIIGVNTYPSYIAAMLSTTTPLWCDLNGYWMAEMQARCHAEGDDSRLIGAWAIERTILRRCDKFSAVSRAQLHAVLGEMATIGRLNRHTFKYRIGAYIPEAQHRWASDEEDGDARPVLRGPIVPDDAFIVLWSGGFNLWTDIPMLSQAMNLLMSRHPNVHFVSTGGKLEGVDTRTYQTFEEAVAESPHKDRYHLLGWVSSEKLPKIYREANVGINIDGPNYETFFGARNRINAMAAEGLPIVTTLGSEISEWLHDADAALTAPMGDPEALAEEIAPYVDRPEALKAIGTRAQLLMEKDFNYISTTRGLREWLERPSNSPDNETKIKLAGGELADFNASSINTLEAQAVLLETYDPRTLLQTKRELDALRKRLWYRAYQRLLRIFGE